MLGRDTVEFQDQFFLYVGDGGLGNKHRLSRLGMTLLRRQNEVLVLAPTGNTASNLVRMFKAYWLACFRVVVEEGLQLVRSLSGPTTQCCLSRRSA
jgi:hypothetical protein